MSSPIQRLITDLSTTPKIRELDRAYHMEMIAENTKDIRDYHLASLRLQSQSAAASMHASAMNFRATGEVARRQDETNSHINQTNSHLSQTNSHLTSIASDLDSLARGVDALSVGMDSLNLGMNSLNEGVDNLNQVARATLGAINNLTSVVSTSLDRISLQIAQQQRTLEEIAAMVRRPYATQMLELRREADKWLTNGMKHSGRDRNEDWKDAMRLLRTVMECPVGKQDYVASFQLGWLLWKHENNLNEAEDAFYRAQRLSSSERNLYHLKSLRHMAYMQYLLDKHEDAHQTIQLALGVSQDHDTMYDAARYAAKTGREQESLDLLDRCIDVQPTTIITMFSEEDFQ